MNANAVHLNQMTQSCSGQCLNDARGLHNAALQSVKPLLGTKQRDIDKRFQILADNADENAHTEAELLLEYTLALYEGALGPNHPLIGKLLTIMGTIYRMHGNAENAALLDNWAAEIVEANAVDATAKEDTFFELFLDGSMEPLLETGEASPL